MGKVIPTTPARTDGEHHVCPTETAKDGEKPTLEGP